ncbi:histidinol-phosphatase [Devosia sp. ZB163]|uniref:histidinol-phosphatase n=1 Tax=Devosia sp. ZB163 TaxID=3025938 RepID=UPI00236307EF|nr:histidinol-phosphatase [Devosia sp. ZB163]MDC9824987.1 histidinol-phosphatase [Devosia sp. ZB163]
MTTDALGGLTAELVSRTLLDAAEIAASHTLPRFRSGLAVDNKLADGFDPVTEADREAELAIRALLEERFPDHAIIGEEWDDKAGAGRFAWIIDPIDGTRAFITGVPVWGTLIGLTVDGKAAAGLMAQPFTGEIYLSLPGEASYYRGFDKEPLKTSKVTELKGAKLTTTSPDLFERDGLLESWSRMRKSVLTTRYGLDCYGYALMAAGHIDLVVEAGLKDVDICPLIPLIENAGGVITTWDGGRAEQGGNCVAAATPELHAAAMALLRG